MVEFEEQLKKDLEEFEEALNIYFPKGVSKERGEALVVYAYGMMVIEKLKKELKKRDSTS